MFRFPQLPIEISDLIFQYIEGQEKIDKMKEARMALQNSFDAASQFVEALQSDYEMAKGKGYNSKRNFINKYLPLFQAVDFYTVEFDGVGDQTELLQQIAKWSSLRARVAHIMNVYPIGFAEVRHNRHQFEGGLRDIYIQFELVVSGALVKFNQAK